MGNTLKIKDLPVNERPRERLLRYGAQTLSNTELIAVILGSGIKHENIVILSSRLLKDNNGLNGLLNLSIDELKNVKGIGLSKASQLVALGEISRRYKSYKSGEDRKITKPSDAAEYLMDDMRYLKQEELRVILLDTKNKVISVKEISRGSLNSSIVHPREVFCEAIKKHSASIIICHNHPSGDPMPSSEDINVTNRLVKCGKLLGIDIIDHIIIGNGAFISLKEKGIL